jgi:peptide-methionine (R)-S-oxide reductase
LYYFNNQFIFTLNYTFISTNRRLDCHCNMKYLFFIGFLFLLLQSCAQQTTHNVSDSEGFPDSLKIVKTDEEWKKILPKEVYDVTRKQGTECAFTDKFKENKEVGTYSCFCCELELFSSSDKFNSGTGWPSYFQVYKKQHVKIERDTSLGMIRDEVSCARCDAHLGHVFTDGPKPTGLRYCINSVALVFKKLDK